MLLVLGLIAALLMGPTAAVAADSMAPATVKIGLLRGGASDYPILLARGMGFFKQEGLTLKSIALQNAGNLIAPLATDEIDVGAGSDSAAFYNAIAHGVYVKIVADKGTMMADHNYQGLVMRKSLITSGRVKTYKDLKGLTFAISGHGVTTEYVLSAALHKGGLTLKDVRTVTMHFPEMLAALTNKSVDGAILGGPLVERAIEKNIAVMWRGSGQFIPGHHISLVLFAPKFANTRPGVADRFMLAYLKGVRAFHDAMFEGINKAKVVKVLMRVAHIKNPKVLTGAGLITVNQNLKVNKPSLVWDQNWYYDHGYIKKKIDVNKVVDMRFADYALNKLGRR